MDVKRVYVIEELCSGCRLCEMSCSFAHAREYNPSKSNIRIFKIEEQGISIPVMVCDSTKCEKMSPAGIPPCVDVCSTGALIFCGADEAVKLRKELAAKRAEHPVFNCIAPWKFPFPSYTSGSHGKIGKGLTAKNEPISK